MSPSPQRFLTLAGTVTAAAIAAAMTLSADHWPPAARWHLVFAVGALPMILAAMGYFVPVLTRSGNPPRGLVLAPTVALGAGLGIVAYFIHGVPALRLAAPWIALAAIAGFAGWLGVRWRGCLGHANPCLVWYAYALGLLSLGLMAVALAPIWPEQARALRVFHLHVNTLGFMGLTALGTLQVLLPTVAGQYDPEAAERLTRDLKWSVGGALLLALGAAWSPSLAVAGTAAYAWPLLRLVAHAWSRWRAQVLGRGTTLPLLAAALVGLGLALGQGALHAFDRAASAGAVPLFIVAFLLPLVSGAVGQLLPVWLRPGVQDRWHRESRGMLAYGARSRALLFPVGGLLAAAGATAGYMIGVLGALWLVFAMPTIMFRKR